MIRIGVLRCACPINQAETLVDGIMGELVVPCCCTVYLKYMGRLDMLYAPTVRLVTEY